MPCIWVFWPIIALRIVLKGDLSLVFAYRSNKQLLTSKLFKMRTTTNTSANGLETKVSRILVTGGLTFLLLFLLTLSNSVLAQESVWGMTSSGGSNDFGTIYKTDRNGGNQEMVYEWTNDENYDIGLAPKKPVMGLVDGKDGYLYGSTNNGGELNTGVFFRINSATNAYEELFQLSSLSESHGLGFTIDHATRTIYAAASFGGTSDMGSIFSLGMNNGEYDELYSWNEAINGNKPEGHPVLHNGSLIGITVYGGANEAGVLYKYNVATGAYNVLKDFNAETVGMAPFFQFEIIENVVYGTTRLGGNHGFGTIYSYNLNNSEFNVLHHFNGEDGEGGRSLTKVANNQLLGNTVKGGAYGNGVLFTYNISTATYTKKVDFDWDNNGGFPSTKLLPIGNNEFMGFTGGGGENGTGLNYKYNLNTNTLSVNFSFTGPNGAQPIFNNLVRVEDADADISIIRQPVGVITCSGQSISLEIEATPNPESLAYQWYRNSIVISGATSPTLVIENATALDAGSYHCNVWDPSAGDGVPTEISSDMAIVEVIDIIHVEVEEETCNPFEVGSEVFHYTSSYGCDSFVTVNKVAAYVNADFSQEIDGATVTFTNESENATHYLWHFGAGEMSMDENPVYEFPGTGFYMVLLVAMKDGCLLDFKLSFIFVFDGLRTSEFGVSERLVDFTEEIKAFPNPTRGPVNLSSEIVFPQDSQFDLTVMDMYGKVVHTEMMNSMNHKFDLSYLAPATYLVKVGVDGKSFEQKIVVSH